MSIDSFIIVFICFILGKFRVIAAHILNLVFHPGLRANVKKDFFRLCCIKIEDRQHKHSIGIRDDAQVYFDQLAEAWK
jgi:hypothetical protein